MGFTKEELTTIDGLVARFVMDYPTYDLDDVESTLSATQSTHLVPLDRVHCLQRPPPFCFDRSLAFAIIDHLEENGYLVKIERTTKGWEVSFRLVANNTLIEQKATSDRLPLAICFAALRVVGINLITVK